MSVRAGAMWGMGCGELLGLLGIFKIYRKNYHCYSNPQDSAAGKSFLKWPSVRVFFTETTRGMSYRRTEAPSVPSVKGELSASGQRATSPIARQDGTQRLQLRRS